MSVEWRVAESVTAGHPDKICDQVAGSILDAAIRACPGLRPRVALEPAVKGRADSGGQMTIYGEVTLPGGAILDYEEIARDTVSRIGYISDSQGFNGRTMDVKLMISQQSQDIANDVGKDSRPAKAGDQGLMFGAAVAGDGPEYMPLPIMMARALTSGLTDLFQQKTLPYLYPDGKSQVIVAYESGRPVGVEQVTIAASHTAETERGQLREDLFDHLIRPVMDRFGFPLKARSRVTINAAAGRFVTHGPLSDSGQTNRKIIVDSYGDFCRHGGGGFNGKDPTKVDMSAPLGARYLAKALVAERLAGRAEIEVAYTIGQPRPHFVNINTFGTETVSDKRLRAAADHYLDMSVEGVMDTLQLFQPLYAKAAVGGWFGRREFPWEQV